MSAKEHQPEAHQFADELKNVRPAQDRLSFHDIKDIRLELTADLGKCSLYVREVLELRRGSVLALNKVAGEMADLYVNGLPFAKGEVVVLVDAINIRIAEVTGASEKDLLAND